MKRQWVTKLSALVISSRPYRENDRLVSLFAPSTGLLHARATSAMELKSHLGMRLHPLTLGIFSIVHTGRSLPILSGVDALSANRHWARPAKRLLTASVILAVLSEVAGPPETCHEFFRMAVNLLRTDPRDFPERALAVFLMRTMQILGVISPVERCSSCGKALVSGSVLAPKALTSFFCVRCFNKAYGGKEVCAVKFSSHELTKLLDTLRIVILDYHRVNLSPKEFSLLVELFKARLSDMLPRTCSLLTSVQAFLNLPSPAQAV